MHSPLHKLIADRLADLRGRQLPQVEADFEQAKAQLYSVQGAIQVCEFILADLAALESDSETTPDKEE